MNIPQSRIVFFAAVLLLVASIGPARGQSGPQLSAVDLVKAVIGKELKSSSSTESRWKYLLYKNVDGKQETREVVQTKFGSLDRLIAVGGKPLSNAEGNYEADRILRLSHHPEEQRKLEEARQKDTERCNAFLQMVPAAFLFEYAESSGNLTKVIFKPNSGFQPPSREGKVLQAMAGEIWIDVKQQRLVSIRGQLVNEVKFAGGLLGHLEKGGQFTVKRTEMVPGNWELTDMAVNMRGKALFFKTISVQQNETHRDFERVPDDLNLSDAAAVLLKQALIAKR